MTTKIDDFIKRVESTAEEDLFTPRTFYSLSSSMFHEMCELLKEQEPRELTIDEWREWKTNPKRNPICELWENDTSPMWVLNPNDVHEPALLIGKLKLFTGKPTFEQCKEVKWMSATIYKWIKKKGVMPMKAIDAMKSISDNVKIPQIFRP